LTRFLSFRRLIDFGLVVVDQAFLLADEKIIKSGLIYKYKGMCSIIVISSFVFIRPSMSDEKPMQACR
jgi:hypothetical protein